MELTKRGRNIYVATSDLVEQHVAFGKGALRVSARELLINIQQNQKAIDVKVKTEHAGKRNSLDGIVSLDVWSRLEKNAQRRMKDFFL